MGRQAKLRKQRTAGYTNSEGKSTQSTSDNSQSSQSLWGKIRNFFSPSQSEETPSPENFEGDYTQDNLRLLGAVAWEGYQSQRRGFVLVVSQVDSPTQPVYIPRPSLRKTLREHNLTAEDIKMVNQFIGEYEPRKAAVLVYIDREGKVSISKPTLDPSPPECYELMEASKEE